MLGCLLDWSIAPKLQVLRIKIQIDIHYPYEHHVYGHTEEGLCEDVVAFAEYLLKYKIPSSSWTRYSAMEALPFKLHLCLYGLLFRGVRWRGVVVDYKEGKVIQGWPAPGWDSEDEDEGDKNGDKDDVENNGESENENDDGNGGDDTGLNVQGLCLTAEGERSDHGEPLEDQGTQRSSPSPNQLLANGLEAVENAVKH